jgi:hypothetical protein
MAGILLIWLILPGVGCMQQNPIAEDGFTAMDFSITKPADHRAVLRFITPGGQEKIDVFESQFADGTRIFESHRSALEQGSWKWQSIGQTEQTRDKVRALGGNLQYHLMEIMDPRITSLAYEYAAGKEVTLKIVDLDGRRFTCYYRPPDNKEEYKLYGLNQKGERIWDKDDPTIDIQQESFLIENAGENVVALQAILPEGYGVGFADLYKDNVIVSLGYRDKDAESYQAYLVLYAVNIHSGESKEIFRGKGYADNWHSIFRVPARGNLAFQTQDTILYIDRETLQVKKEISLPPDGYHYAISNDGAKIAYGKNHNLYAADIADTGIGATEQILLVKGQTNKGPDGEQHGGPGSPQWSNNDKRLSYTLFTYEESDGFGVVNAEGTGNIEFKPKGFIPDRAVFYNRDEKVLAFQVTFAYPKVFTYHLNTKELAEIAVEKTWRNYAPHPTLDLVALTDQGKPILYNLETKEKTEISPDLKDINYIKWDDTGERIIAQSSNDRVFVIDFQK